MTELCWSRALLQLARNRPRGPVCFHRRSGRISGGGKRVFGLCKL